MVNTKRGEANLYVRIYKKGIIFLSERGSSFPDQLVPEKIMYCEKFFNFGYNANEVTEKDASRILDAVLD